MNPIVLAIIIITSVISAMGFQNTQFFNRYKFQVAPIQRNREYIRLISAGFLHGSWSHLIFNMLTLFFFADPVIQAFGNLGFVVIYFGSIVLGNLFCLYVYKNVPQYAAIGASGGVSGILFAAIAILPLMKIYFYFIPIPIPGYIFGFLYFSYSVYMMLNPSQNDNIGHAAHLGGAFFGFAYAVANEPKLAVDNGLYLAIMAVPLIYMGYQVFYRKRIG